MNSIVATYKKNRSTFKRAYPWTFTLGRIINGIFTIAFPFFIYTYFSQKNLNNSFTQYTQSNDYMTYITLGAAIQILGVSSMLHVGRSLIIELWEGTLAIFLLTPASRIGYLVGCLLENVTRVLIQFIIILVCGYLLGANLSGLFTLQSLFTIVFTIIVFFSMGLMLSSIILLTRDTYITQNTINILMAMLCGVAFPIEYLPAWVQPLSHLFPLTSTLELFRSVVLLKQDMFANIHVIYEALLLSISYIIIGALLLRKLEKKLTESIFY
ncbi:MAG: ABC transporter permease [Lutisporaceae bacterium]